MRIFIIDDDRLSIFLTENMLALENATHDVKSFLSGTEALEALQDCSDVTIPDIIFLDLNMHMMDGWEFLDALAPLEPKLRNKCSVYILTSSLDVSDTAKSIDYALVSGFIHKPLTSEDINMVVSQYN